MKSMEINPEDMNGILDYKVRPNNSVPVCLECREMQREEMEKLFPPPPEHTGEEE